MNLLLLIVTIISLLTAVILAIACYLQRTQIKSIIRQLKFIQSSETNIKLTQIIPDAVSSDLAREINNILNQHNEIRRLLKKSNAQVKEVISNISHDLRTPLTSANGYIQMLQNPDCPPEKKSEYTVIIQERIDTVRRLLDQLLEYVRTESGELQLEEEMLILNNLLMDTLALYYHDFSTKKADPIIDITDIPLKITGDTAAIKRIFSNLINNSLVHGTDHHHIRLYKEENQAVFVIKNQTTTIHPQDIPQIFDRFYTSDQSRSRKTTGLGLAITKNLTERMDGTIEASLENNWFKIVLKFPLIKSPRK